MTEDENYYFDDGYHRATDFICKQIDILFKFYPNNPALVQLLLSINQARHSRNDVDRISEKLINKIDKKE